MPPETGPVLIAQLGSGGMADVFLAMRQGVGGFAKLVVVKRIRASAIEDPTALAMFADEARIAARLNHPNIVQTHEVSFDGDDPRLEMEFLDGQPLHRILHRAKKASRTIELGIICEIIRGTLAGLHYAHELQDFDGSPLHVVHRDISPPNVFITYTGHVKIVDFGIAKSAGQAATTAIGIVKGKARYMAPEQACGKGVDRRADVFAVGVMLWEFLTGVRFWGQADELEVFRRLMGGDVPKGPRVVRPEIPESLDAVCARAVAANADERFATADEFLAALENATPADRQAGRRLGELTAELFAEDRKRLREEIEKTIARVKDSEEEVEPTKVIGLAIDSGSFQSAGSLPGVNISEPPGTTRTPPPPSRRKPRVFESVMGGASALIVIGLGVLVATRWPVTPQVQPAVTVTAPVAAPKETAPAIEPTPPKPTASVTVDAPPPPPPPSAHAIVPTPHTGRGALTAQTPPGPPPVRPYDAGNSVVVVPPPPPPPEEKSRFKLDQTPAWDAGSH